MIWFDLFDKEKNIRELLMNFADEFKILFMSLLGGAFHDVYVGEKVRWLARARRDRGKVRHSWQNFKVYAGERENMNV